MRWCKGREAALSRPRASPGVLCPLSRGTDPNASTAFLGAPLPWHSPLRQELSATVEEAGSGYCRWSWLHASAAALPGGPRPLRGSAQAQLPDVPCRTRPCGRDQRERHTAAGAGRPRVPPEALSSHGPCALPEPHPHSQSIVPAATRPSRGRVGSRTSHTVLGSGWGSAGGKTLSQAVSSSENEDNSSNVIRTVCWWKLNVRHCAKLAGQGTLPFPPGPCLRWLQRTIRGTSRD